MPSLTGCCMQPGVHRPGLHRLAAQVHLRPAVLLPFFQQGEGRHQAHPRDRAQPHTHHRCPALLPLPPTAPPICQCQLYVMGRYCHAHGRGGLFGADSCPQQIPPPRPSGRLTAPACRVGGGDANQVQQGSAGVWLPWPFLYQIHRPPGPASGVLSCIHPCWLTPYLLHSDVHLPLLDCLHILLTTLHSGQAESGCGPLSSLDRALPDLPGLKQDAIPASRSFLIRRLCGSSKLPWGVCRLTPTRRLRCK